MAKKGQKFKKINEELILKIVKEKSSYYLCYSTNVGYCGIFKLHNYSGKRYFRNKSKNGGR